MAWLEYLLPLIFLFPLAAMGGIVVALRNLHDARVRSPFDAQPLREPGQHLRDRLDDAFASLYLNGALGPLVTLVPLVYGMGRMIVSAEQHWVEWAFHGALSTLLVLAYSFRLMRDFQRIRRLKLGLACELAVGQELERLVRPEAHPFYVFHDVPAAGTRIDHVVVTPCGVFVVETRARTRPFAPSGEELDRLVVEPSRLRFPGWSERKPLAKTRELARWMAEWLSSRTGRTVPVMGVLTLPGWKVEADQGPGDLLVGSGDDLASRLAELCPGEFDAATHDAVIATLLEHAGASRAPGE